MKKTLIASTSLLTLCLALPAAAQGTDYGGSAAGSSPSPAGGMTDGGAPSSAAEGGAQSGKAGPVSRQDRKFVEDAAEGGMAEVQLGQIAAQRAQNQGVRDFGSKMVSDHTPANQRLLSLASSLGITPPDKMGFMHRHLENKLRKAEGKEFDEEYLEGQIKDHKKMAELMENEIKDGQNAELKQFASDMLPKIREHLQMAQSLRDQIKQNKQ